MFFQNVVNDWDASWIWRKDDCWTVNRHLLARKRFTLGEKPADARLRISACSDYVLYVNGCYVGRGPLPCDPSYQSYDEYDVANLLQAGDNVLAVLCHNFAIGMHWRHRQRGGLIAQLDANCAGGPITVSTDDSWRMIPADCHALNSPRQFWSCGFQETFDFRKYDDAWTAAKFDDSAWPAADVLGRHPTKPWRQLIPREISPAAEAFESAVRVEVGRCSLSDVHVLRFDPILSPSREGIVYAETHVHCAKPCDAILHLECDDALKMFQNGNLILEKSYSEYFARTRNWRAKDEYEQVHFGVGAPGQRQPIRLEKGDNRFLVAVDHGAQGWGFTLAFLDPTSRKPLALPFGAEEAKPNTWRLAGPTPSNSLCDSLDDVATDLSRIDAPHNVLVSPFDYLGVTDAATLMLYEKREGFAPAADPALISLHTGQVAIFDLGVIRAGFPRMDIESADDAVLDIGYSHVLPDDRGIRFYQTENLKYVDRVQTRAGRQSWQCLQRRTGRYLHVSCRAGAGVVLRGAGVVAVGHPVRDVATFECSDESLNRIWRVSRYTQKLLMQDSYQDCMRREQSTLNTSSFNYMTRSSTCCFGDFDLARRALRIGARTQHDTGWFDSHGLSSPNTDEFTECLWWAVWLKDFYLYSGDRAFVGELFETLEDNLRFFAKSARRNGLLDQNNLPVTRNGQSIYLTDELTGYPFARLGFEGEVASLNLLFIAALNAAARLAEALDLPERQSFYARKAEHLTDTFRRRFWNARLVRFSDWRRGDELSDDAHATTQIAAVYFGLADEQQTRSILDYLCNEVGLPTNGGPNYPLWTFGFYYYFLEILFRHGRDDFAYRLIDSVHGQWLRTGATTFGEFYWPWKKVETPPLDEYEVHGYGTSAHLHFYNNILGIQPLAAGFTKVLLRPRPGSLTHANGTIATVQGDITVSWRVENATFHMDARLPKTCRYELDLPDGFTGCHVTVNGQPCR